jgi:hypothetical protein
MSLYPTHHPKAITPSPKATSVITLDEICLQMKLTHQCLRTIQEHQRGLEQVFACVPQEVKRLSISTVTARPYVKSMFAKSRSLKEV